MKALNKGRTERGWLMLRMAVLAGGSGDDLQVVLNAQNSGTISDARVMLVVSDSATAQAVATAENAAVKTAVISREDFEDADSWETALAKELKKNSIDMLLLTDFEGVLSAKFIGQFANRIINVHPSLVPAFCGDSMVGMAVHKAVLARGVKVTGATVHYLTATAGEGEIVAQKAVEVLRGDSPETLAKRVKEKGVWQILPRAIQLVAEDAALMAAVQGTTCMRRNPYATDAMF